MRLAACFAFGLAAAAWAGQLPLCCGRGGTPLGPRSQVPLAERPTPWAGDVVLALEARGGPAVQAALSAVPGVQRVEVEAPRHLARVWLADPSRAPIAELCAAARAAGCPASPALLSRFALSEAGEKGLVERAARALTSTPGVVAVEVEVEGEAGLARAWCRAGTTPDVLASVLSRASVPARALRDGSLLR